MIPYLNLEYFYQRIFEWLPVIWAWLLAGFDTLSLIWKIILPLLSLVLLYGIIRLSINLRQLRKIHGREPTIEELDKMEAEGMVQSKRNERWEKILKYMESENASEWKLAIMEADTILDDLVRIIQPIGDNLGERLKNIDQGDFPHMQQAWEAHKVRNRIAHEHDYQLTRREASQTINLYEMIFRDFNYL